MQNFLRLSIGVLVIALVVIFILPIHRRIPETKILQVPFTAQAPTNNWEGNQDCEEASIAMANAYLNGQTQNKMSVRDAVNAIKQLNTWEKVNFGYNLDTGAIDSAKLAEGAFAMKARIVKDFTEEDLKKALASNLPVLLPHDARKLGSPKYAFGGPDYHMFVIRGYNEDGFIVNDPGTNEGNGNVYSFETIWNAAGDWNQAEQKIEPENKYIVILSK